jgi:hypothetical protein
MKLHLTTLDWIASILVIIGAINWGLVGLFEFDLVGAIFGIPVARVIFTLVGLAGLYMIYALSKFYRVERRVTAGERV